MLREGSSRRVLGSRTHDRSVLEKRRSEAVVYQGSSGMTVDGGERVVEKNVLEKCKKNLISLAGRRGKG